MNSNEMSPVTSSVAEVTSSASTSAVAEGGGRDVHAANDVSYIISIWVDSMFIRSNCASMFRGACIVCDMTFTFVVYIFLFFVFYFYVSQPNMASRPAKRPSSPLEGEKNAKRAKTENSNDAVRTASSSSNSLHPALPSPLSLSLPPFHRLSFPSSVLPLSSLPLTIHMFIRPSILLPSIHQISQPPSFHRLSFFPSLSLPLSLPSTSICTSVHPFIFPSIHHSINQSVHLFLCPSTDLFFVHFKADSTSRPTKRPSSPLGEEKSAKRAKTADPVNTVR